jgi:chemotaxis protein MotB
MRELLRLIGEVLVEVPNRLTLEGHTDSTPYGGGERGYSNWELSADRANASRRELIAGGLPEERTLRVQGLAASVPIELNDTLNPANRRISIIVMNRDAEDRLFGIVPDRTESTPETPAVTTAGNSPSTSTTASR